MSSPVSVGGTPVAAAGVADTQPRADLTDRALVAITALVTLPLLWMGYGTDIDVTDVLRTAAGIRDGDYRPSRPPGVPVFEAIAAVLDPVRRHLDRRLRVGAGVLRVGCARPPQGPALGRRRAVRPGHRHPPVLGVPAGGVPGGRRLGPAESPALR